MILSKTKIIVLSDGHIPHPGDKRSKNAWFYKVKGPKYAESNRVNMVELDGMMIHAKWEYLMLRTVLLDWADIPRSQSIRRYLGPNH